MKFYKTIIQVEVLSEDQPVNNLSLKQIVYEITEGDCVGTSEIISAREISPSDCAEELSRMGSEPEFFNLDDDGNSLWNGESNE